MARNRVEAVSVGGRIILKLIFKKWVVEGCTGLIWLGIEANSGRL
jgi:hypothetical protein